jgi:hypothetical protein
MTSFPPSRPVSAFAQTVAELAAQGVRLRARPGEYVVNIAAGGDATAYVTDDLADAIEHGSAMAATIEHRSSAVPSADAPRGKRPRRLRRMTPKAIRRRAIKRHNRRRHARALRQTVVSGRQK